MRLVDADELILHLNDFMLQLSPIDVQDIESIKVSAVIQDCIKAIENQPTVYDVDKVVERLAKGSYETTDTVCGGRFDAIRLSSAIEIVKRGGVDD